MNCDFMENYGTPNEKKCNKPVYIGEYDKALIIASAEKKSGKTASRLVNAVKDLLKYIDIMPAPPRVGPFIFNRCKEHCGYKQEIIGLEKNNLYKRGGFEILDYHKLPYCNLNSIKDKCSESYIFYPDIDRIYHIDAFEQVKLMKSHYDKQVTDQQKVIDGIANCIERRSKYNSAYKDPSDVGFPYLPPEEIISYISHGRDFILNTLEVEKTECERKLNTKTGSYNYNDAIDILKRKYLINDKSSKLNDCINELYTIIGETNDNTNKMKLDKCGAILNFSTENQCKYNNYFNKDFDDADWRKMKTFYLNNCTGEKLQTLKKINKAQIEQALILANQAKQAQFKKIQVGASTPRPTGSNTPRSTGNRTSRSTGGSSKKKKKSSTSPRNTEQQDMLLNKAIEQRIAAEYQIKKKQAQKLIQIEKAMKQRLASESQIKKKQAQKLIQIQEMKKITKQAQLQLIEQVFQPQETKRKQNVIDKFSNLDKIYKSSSL